MHDASRAKSSVFLGVDFKEDKSAIHSILGSSLEHIFIYLYVFVDKCIERLFAINFGTHYVM